MLLLVCGSAVGQAGPEPAEGATPINMNLRDADLRDLLPLLSDAVGLNVILAQDVDVHVPFLALRERSHEEVLEALRALVQAEGYHWREIGDVHLVTTTPPAEERPEAEPAAGPAASEPPLLSAPEPVAALPTTALPPPAPEMQYAEIELRNVDAAEVARIFGGRALHSMPSPTHLNRTRQAVQRPGTGLGAVGGAMSAYAQPNPFVPLANPVLNQFGGYDDGGDYGGGFGGGFGGLGGGFGGSMGGGFGLVELLPGEMLPPLAYMPLNRLIVQGTQAELDAFREIVALLDVAPRQVEITTQFIEVEANLFEAFGSNWSVNAGAWEIFPVGTGLSGNLVARFTGQAFQASIGLALQRSKGRIVNAPRVVTLNNQFAEFQVSTTIPYFVPQTQVTQGVVTTTFTPQFIDVVNGLFVTPRINADDTISMWLQPQLSDQVGLVTDPAGQTTVPIVSDEFVSALVRVPDGETAVMGGLVRRNDVESTVAVPFLSELPIIGKFFRRRELNKSDRELLIFVTPRIIRERGGGLETSY
jgi:type II secretory pathway component GspD/PulD (secretin)